MPEEIAPELADHIRRVAAAHGITIASVQGTFNMSHPDAEHRRAGLRRLRVMASSCQRLGTSIIGICIGTRDREDMWRHHPDNDSPEAWRDMLGCVREATAIAEQAAVTLAVRAGGEQRRRFGAQGQATARRNRLAAPEDHDGRRQSLPRRRTAADWPRCWTRLSPCWAKTSCWLMPRISITTAKRGIWRPGMGGWTTTATSRCSMPAGFRGPLLLHGLTECAGARLRGVPAREARPHGGNFFQGRRGSAIARVSCVFSFQRLEPPPVLPVRWVAPGTNERSVSRKGRPA